jgi:hypothetical protein
MHSIGARLLPLDGSGSLHRRRDLPTGELNETRIRLSPGLPILEEESRLFFPSEAPRMAQLTQRIASRVPEDPVQFWLSRLDDDTRKANRSHFNRWMKWLHTQTGWENVTDRDLVVRQLESEDGYLALDLLQRYVNGLVLRKSSKRKAYSVVRSFFLHNRCALPRDPSFRVRGDKPSVQRKLTSSVLDHQRARSLLAHYS